ncbi:17022_t:CDS:2 [Funneliformis geosporum]|nr:17022_t:CDS:2 [Funneliformis geosporum]
MENKINRSQINITLELPKKLEKHLKYLETVSKRPLDFIVREALIQYLEDAEDITKYYKKVSKNDGKTLTIEWKKLAWKSLVKIDRIIAQKIKIGVETDLARDPYHKGKPLTGQRKGQWRYRFSNYRVIYEIKEQKLLIVVVEVGHRKEIYLT